MTISITLKRKGFTLAELMVAMGITVILLSLLVSVTGVALDGWRVSRNKVRAARQAKAALDQLSKDFESIVIRGGNNYEWFYTESNDDPPGPTTSKSPNAADIIMLTAATDRYNGDIGGNSDFGGDVSAVGYSLFYKDPILGREGTDYDVFALYRKLVNPNETYETLLAENDLQAAFERNYGDTIDESANFVCENIYEMSVIFLIEYTVPQLRSSPLTKIARVPVLATGGGDVAGNFRQLGSTIEVDGSDAEDYSKGRIIGVDLSLTVLTDGGIATLRRSKNLRDKALDRFIQKNSYRYTKTVLVPQP